MAGLGKRVAEVPHEARYLAENLSKADLLEMAWALASLCNQGEGCDDDAATLRRLHEEANTWRENRGGQPLPPLDALREKWARWYT